MSILIFGVLVCDIFNLVNINPFSGLAFHLKDCPCGYEKE